MDLIQGAFHTVFCKHDPHDVIYVSAQAFLAPEMATTPDL